MKYFLSLGSNVGDREKNLARALFLLQEEGVEVLKVSSIYETQPVDLASQPWFYNQIAEIEANVYPRAFLALAKKIEKKMGREEGIQKGPRIIDIDIILAEGTIVRTQELEIPHPRMEKRNFVLLPLMEISPDTVHPLLNESIKDLLKKSNDCSVVKRIKETKDRNL